MGWYCHRSRLFKFHLELEIPNLWFLRPICASLHATLKIFSSPFDVDSEEKVPLQLKIKLNDLQCSEDFKFLACYILNFSKAHMLPSGPFPNFITHIQQVVNMFGITFCSEELFLEMKRTKSMLHLQLSNHHLSDVLLMSTSSFNPEITSSFYDCKQHQMSL